MLTEALAIELGPHGIRVNAIAPGLVTDTPLRATDPNLTPYIRMMLDMTPLGRTGAPADIAEVILFLASERNAWMTGSIVDVSGGSHTGRPHVPLPRPPSETSNYRALACSAPDCRARYASLDRMRIEPGAMTTNSSSSLGCSARSCCSAAILSDSGRALKRKRMTPE